MLRSTPSAIPNLVIRGLAAQSRGFTLIELLVVVSLSIILMLSASALFLTFLVGNSKTASLQLVKSEGQQALSQMEFLLRNAVELEVNSTGYRCADDMSEIVLRSADGKLTKLFKETDPSDSKEKIASNSGVYLTSGAVDLELGPTFNCTEEVDRKVQHVKIIFVLRRGTPGINQPKEIVTQTFETGVNVRTY